VFTVTVAPAALARSDEATNLAKKNADGCDGPTAIATTATIRRRDEKTCHSSISGGQWRKIFFVASCLRALRVSAR
jgi:hypothetical protein